MTQSSPNCLSTALLIEGNVLSGTFAPCDGSPNIQVVVNTTSTESTGRLIVQFSNDASTVTQTVQQLFVTCYHRNKIFACVPRDKFFRVRFEAVNTHDTRSPAVSNNFAALSVTTVVGCRGGDLMLGERVLTLRGRTTVTNGLTSVVGNGLTLDTVATFPVLTTAVSVRIVNSGTANDATGTGARTFMVTGLDADMNELIWCGDVVSVSTNSGASQTSPVPFLAVNDVRILSFGASGKAEVGSTLQVQMDLNGWCCIAQLDDSTYFQYRTLAYTVPNGCTATVHNVRISTTDRSAVNTLQVHCLQKQSRVPLHVYRTPSAPKKAVTVRPSRVLPAGTLVVAECSSVGSTSSVSVEVNLSISGTAASTSPNLRTPLLSVTNIYAAETYTEETQLSITALVVTNTASSTAKVVMTLSDASAGSIAGSAASTNTVGTVTTGTLAAGAGNWTMDTSTGIWQATATNSALNTLLGTLVFTPAANYNSSFRINLSVDTNDDGPTDVVYGTKLVAGIAVNDPPAATNLSAAETYTEAQALSLTPIVVSDVDNTTLTVTLSFAANASVGTINTPTVNSTVPTFSVGVWSATGPVADLNSILGQLTFTSASGHYEDFVISTSVSDGSLSTTGTKAMTGIPLFAATNLNAAETYTEDTPKALIAIVVSSETSVTATLTLGVPSAGSLNTGTSGAVTSTYNAGTGVWTASGAVANVNTLLGALTFTPAANYNSNFTIGTSIDNGATTLTGIKSIFGTAVNDAPMATNLSASQSYTPRRFTQTSATMTLTAIVIADVDNSSVTATLTMSNAAAGTLSTGTSGAVTSTYNVNTGVWTASGAVSDVNTLLAAVVYAPTTGYAGSFSIGTSISDGTATASGTKTISPTITTIASVTATPIKYRYSAKNVAGNNSVPSAGSVLGSWVSIGTTSFTLSESIDARKPTYEINQFGLNPGVYFNLGARSGNILESSSASLATQGTVVMLLNPFIPTADYQLLSSQGNTGGANQIMRMNSNGGTTLTTRNSATADGSYTWPIGPSLAILRYKTSSVQSVSMRVNGTALSITGNISTAQYQWGVIGGLGGYTNNPNGGNAPQGVYKGAIAEILFYEVQLSDAECVALEAYFASNWPLIE